MILNEIYEAIFVHSLRPFFFFVLFTEQTQPEQAEARFRAAGRNAARQGSSIKKEFSRLALNDVTQFPRVSSSAFVHAHPFPFVSKQRQRMAMIDCFFRAQFSDARSTPNAARQPTLLRFLFSARLLSFSLLLHFVRHSISSRACARRIFSHINIFTFHAVCCTLSTTFLYFSVNVLFFKK